MRKYVIFIAGHCDGEAGCSSDLPQVSKRVVDCLNLIKTELVTSSNDVFIAPIIADVHKNVVQVPRSESIDWLPVQSDTSLEDLINTASTESAEYEPLLSSCLHQLLDKIPYTGAVLDVIIQAGHPLDANSSSFVSLYGCLKRLTEWHNAKVTIIDETDGHKDGVTLLASYLQANVQTHIDDVQLRSHDVWRGKVSLLDRRENTGFMLPGFSLEYCSSDEEGYHAKSRHKWYLPADDNELEFLGRTLEVIDEVCTASIPAFLISPLKFRVQLSPGHAQSECFLEHMKENARNGVIMRLARYRGQVPTCGEKALNTSQWKDCVLAGLQYIQEPEEDLLDSAEFLHFLVVPEENQMSAYVMRSPDEINGAISDVLYNKFLQHSQGPCDLDIGSLLSNVPEISGGQLKDLHRDVCHHQITALKNWIATTVERGEPATMTADELFVHLSNTQHDYMLKFKEKLPKAQLRDVSEISLTAGPSDLDVSAADWPERLSLTYRESQKRVITRLQSTESISLSSPMQQPQSNTIEVKDFLNYFRSDGSAASTKLSPLRIRHRSRSQLMAGSTAEIDAAKIHWPESKHLNYPDIYYNRDKRSEKFEQYFNKLRQRFVSEETYSSCSSQTFTLPKKKVSAQRASINKQPMSAPSIRRSPRALKTLCSKGRELRSHESRTLIPGSVIPPNRRPHRESRSMSGGLSSLRTSSSDLTGVLSRKISTADHDARALKLSRTNERPQSAAEDEAQSDKQSRSERHKKRLEKIVSSVLAKEGVPTGSDIYDACAIKLFKVTKLYVMDLLTSQNLAHEMKTIAEGQVKQVVDLENRRRNTAKGSRQSK